VAHEYDTADRDLEQARMTLSRHPSEAGVDWRLTLPRGEQVEGWEPGTSGLVPPPEILRVIESTMAGKDLVPRPEARARPRDVPPPDEYSRFEELARQLVRTPGPRQAGSGAT
jgi:hypothetical protein